ncbi:hypothetical protein CO709_08585 [Burkholderia thailandensis]|nr:hypothetical protein CO709_08585 [Burkholderia thailandensis]
MAVFQTRRRAASAGPRNLHEAGPPGNSVEIVRLPYNSGSFRSFRSNSWQSSPPNRASNTKT